MEKLYNGYQEIQEEIIGGYMVSMKSTYNAKANDFTYSFGIQIMTDNEFYDYAPDMDVRRDWFKPDSKPEVVIQTHAKGALNAKEYQEFMLANQQAYHISRQIEKKIHTFIEYHEVVLLRQN